MQLVVYIQTTGLDHQTKLLVVVVSCSCTGCELPRKHFHGFLGFGAMEASGSFYGRSEAQRLPRNLRRKLFVKASTKAFREGF